MAADGREVDLSELSADQLQQVHRGMNEEIQSIGTQLNALRHAHARFHQANNAVSNISSATDDTPMLVPLTSSLYIPGKITNVNKLLIDIGTGYFIEKSIPDSKTFINGKIDMLTKSIEKVSQALLAKKKDYDTVGMVLQAKVAALKQYQQQQAEKTAIKSS